MFTAITLHTPHPRHRADLAEFMSDVIAALSALPGLLEAHVAEAADGSRLAGVTQWETESDFDRALPTILSFAPRRQPRWTTEPDEALRLRSLAG